MIGRRDRLIAVLIGLVVTAVTLAFSTEQGINRDEAYYMDAGERYVAYWEGALSGSLPDPLSDASIRPYWRYNREHPPLMKVLYGLSWRLLHRCDCAADARLHPEVARLPSGQHATLGLLSEVAAFRLPNAVAFGLLCALVYLFFVQALGGRVGALAAALLTFAQPRAFYHAQTASFDPPAATLWLAGTWAYWRALRLGTWRSAWLCGLVFGCFVATKLQSFFLPVALGVHWLWLFALRHRRGEARPTFKPLLAMAVLGPVMLFASWPWLWHAPVRRLSAYLRFHLTHVHYDFEYLGRNLVEPPFPWHEPLVMLLFTAPVVLLVLAGAGAVALARSPAGSAEQGGAPGVGTRALLLIAGLLPIVIFMTGRAPIYGATKHWLACMPFLALCAGVALDRLAVGLRRELDVRTVGAGLAISFLLLVVAFVPAWFEVRHSHPYGLSHYNALAGGAPGGADLGLNRQFWGYAVKGVFPWLDDNLPERTRLYLHDCNWDSYEIYRRSGDLRRDIAGLVVRDSRTSARALRRGSDAALVVHEKHFNRIDHYIWRAYGHLRPSEVLTLHGVPLVSVYLRDRPDEQAPPKSNESLAR